MYGQGVEHVPMHCAHTHSTRPPSFTCPWPGAQVLREVLHARAEDPWLRLLVQLLVVYRHRLLPLEGELEAVQGVEQPRLPWLLQLPLSPSSLDLLQSCCA